MFKLTPKQKIWVRVAIYVPLIAFFGYRAYQAHRARTAPPPQVQPAPETPDLQGTKREYVLPNGQTVTVTEMTEEQARAQGFNVPDEPKDAEAAPAGDTGSTGAPEAETEAETDAETGTATED